MRIREPISIAARFITYILVVVGSTMSITSNAEPMAREVAVFAGGCFWCTESDFDKIPGVLKTTSGYAGGTEDNVSYEWVSSGRSSYVEAVQVEYDPRVVSFGKLVQMFWKTIDPSVSNRQFCDAGPQYRSAIFFMNDTQKTIAEKSRSELVGSKRFQTVYTEVLPVRNFKAAEEYHQDYYQKNPIRYNYYRSRCGRDQRLQQIWGE